MKKLKKFVLNSSISRLTDFEQLSIVGGNTSTTSCSDQAYEQCSGICYSYGYQGNCGWIKTNSRCACSVIYVN